LVRVERDRRRVGGTVKLDANGRSPCSLCGCLRESGLAGPLAPRCGHANCKAHENGGA
jgi:hypothetical protein